ncbi:hypothetical protein PRZ48_001909 [Zasmidium cellare]|uniref:AB hydrolase-1 domain-containing protein n=1 Tax=Zasmidium cellare TaxID=395010 RepID=A0ABR0F2J3_ZASCE|nr:hypothetical protein PRZ48_001909 [Zasmidium cellare]
MSSKPSIIFVPGAWHSEVHVQPFVGPMEQLEYRVVPVVLESNKRLVLWDENVKVILHAIQAEVEAGHKVCVVGHSVSGISVVLALSKFFETASAEQKQQIVQVLFIACFFDAIRSTSEIDWYDLNFDTGVPNLGEAKLIRPAEEVFYNDMPATEAKPFVAALKMNTAQMPPEDLVERVKIVRAGCKRICYFVCLKDKAIAPKFQRLEAEEAGFEAVEIDQDHCPMVTQPKTLADEFHKVLSTVAS